MLVNKEIVSRLERRLIHQRYSEILNDSMARWQRAISHPKQDRKREIGS